MQPIKLFENSYCYLVTCIILVNFKILRKTGCYRRLSQLCINLVEKYSKTVVEDTYPRYMTEMTRQAHGGWHRPILQQDSSIITLRDRVLLG
jgi:hypothetical protein